MTLRPLHHRDDYDMQVAALLEPVSCAYDTFMPPAIHDAMHVFVTHALFTHPRTTRTVDLAIVALFQRLTPEQVRAWHDITAGDTPLLQACEDWIAWHKELDEGDRARPPSVAVADAALRSAGQKVVTILAMEPASTTLEAEASVRRWGAAVMAAILAGIVGIARHRGWARPIVDLPPFALHRAEAAFFTALGTLSHEEQTSVLDHYVDVSAGLTFESAWVSADSLHQQSLERLGQAIQRLSLS